MLLSDSVAHQVRKGDRKPVYYLSSQSRYDGAPTIYAIKRGKRLHGIVDIFLTIIL